MRRVTVPAGTRFGRLVVQERSDLQGRARLQAAYRVQCDCGTIKVVALSSLKHGTVSCGCYHREDLARRSTKHGALSGHKRSPNDRPSEYRIWMGMRQRCEDSAHHNYARYGGRGVRLCTRWRESFATFLADMGSRPSKNHSIDRIDVNGNYEPANCRWATAKEQSRNKSNNKMLTLGDRTQCIAAWAEELGLKPVSLHSRLSAGWSIERALSVPRGGL